MPSGFQHRHWWALLLATVSLVACSRPGNVEPGKWNPKAAARYLDQRQVTWIAWPSAARDHGTFCVSCHTVLPYVLSRPALRSALAEQGPSDIERKVVENVAERVRLWKEIGPYYSGQGYESAKPAESRGTEAILNALILATNDARGGKLSDITRTAFNNMWALQLREGNAKGSWSWLNFGLEPWETADSQYYGAALAALTIGIAPENYHSSSDIQERVGLLISYLNRESSKQSLMNRVVLLWASTKLPGLLTSDQQKSIVRDLVKEQKTDGGWELSSNAWPESWSLHSIVRKRLRPDWTRQSVRSDGYATGLITLVLEEMGMSRENPTVSRALAWLSRNQSSADGSWYSSSLEKNRSSSSNIGHFMRDAATAYAVMALSKDTQVSGIDFVGQNHRQDSLRSSGK